MHAYAKPSLDGNFACSGLNLLDCIRLAKRFGCDVQPVKRTGEIRFTHPNIEKSVRVDGRRKDAPRALTAWLNRLARTS
jgi:hypothetical protein